MTNSSKKNNNGNYTYCCLTYKSTMMPCLEAFFSPQFIVSFPKGGKLHLASLGVRHTQSSKPLRCSTATVLSISNTCSISWVKNMLLTYLPEYWAPPVRWSLDLEIILILPDRGGTVLIKLVQVGPDSIALVPALASSLCLLGPTDVATRTHPSQLEWEHSRASPLCVLASGS